jgi:hypothetical protein
VTEEELAAVIAAAIARFGARAPEPPAPVSRWRRGERSGARIASRWAAAGRLA